MHQGSHLALAYDTHYQRNKTLNKLIELAFEARSRGKHAEALVELFGSKNQNAETHYVIGILLADIGNLDAALYFLGRSAELDRTWSTPMLDAGAVHASMGNWREAVKCCDDALGRNANDPMPLLHSANLLSNLGRHKEAYERYEKALGIEGLNIQVWSDFFLSMNYTDITPAERKKKIEEFNLLFSEHFPQRSMEAPSNVRIRIGYVSSDLRNHAMSYFLKGIVPFHDRESFDVFFYHNSPIQDEITQKISSGGTLVACHQMSDEELHERIKSDAIDILIDLNGHTTGNRLKVFMMRSAPVQISWLGFAGTTACPNMDYKIIEAGTATGADQTLYTEEILPLEGVISYDPPDYDVDPGELPLNEHGFVTYACFNNPRKVNESTLAAWAEILRRNRDSRMFMLSTGSEEKDNEIARSLDQEASGRVWFIKQMPTEEFIRTMAKADVALDPFPHGGGTTAAHALWMGVPTFTLKGETELQLSSLIMEMNGLYHFVSSSVDEYIDKASTVDASVLDRKRRPIVSTGERSARRLEDAYRRLIEKRKRGA